MSWAGEWEGGFRVFQGFCQGGGGAKGLGRCSGWGDFGANRMIRPRLSELDGGGGGLGGFWGPGQKG